MRRGTATRSSWTVGRRCRWSDPNRKSREGCGRRVGLSLCNIHATPGYRCVLASGDSVARCARIAMDRPLQKPALGELTKRWADVIGSAFDPIHTRAQAVKSEWHAARRAPHARPTVLL